MLPPMRGKLWEISTPAMLAMYPQDRDTLLTWAQQMGVDAHRLTAVRIANHGREARFLLVDPFEEIQFLGTVPPLPTRVLDLWSIFWEPNYLPANEAQEAAEAGELKAKARIYNSSGKLVDIIEDES